MGYFEIDGVPVKNTPDNIQWEPPTFLGEDGDGAPSYAPYWSCRLSFSLTSIVQLQHWSDAMDGDTHTIRLPHPISGVWTDFTSVYIRYPSVNLSTRDLNRVSGAGVDLMLTHISVTVN